MHDDHDHSVATHSAGCDEEGCTFVAKVHAHDDNTAVEVLSQMLAEHNEEEHGIETDPKEIMDAVEGKMETHG
jgi:hypothetical protein